MLRKLWRVVIYLLYIETTAAALKRKTIELR
jgi:hypothetical protein